jgi:Homeodomain
MLFTIRLPSCRELAMNNDNLKDNNTFDDIKKKRQRTSKEQLQALNQLFEVSDLPTSKQRQELGDKIGMSPRSVQVWFQNKRQNMKRNQADGLRPLSPMSLSPPGSFNPSPSPSAGSDMGSQLSFEKDVYARRNSYAAEGKLGFYRTSSTPPGVSSNVFQQDRRRSQSLQGPPVFNRPVLERSVSQCSNQTGISLPGIKTLPMRKLSGIMSDKPPYRFLQPIPSVIRRRHSQTHAVRFDSIRTHASTLSFKLFNPASDMNKSAAAALLGLNTSRL